jgi:hypothetical protein
VKTRGGFVIPIKSTLPSKSKSTGRRNGVADPTFAELCSDMWPRPSLAKTRTIPDDAKPAATSTSPSLSKSPKASACGPTEVVAAA